MSNMHRLLAVGCCLIPMVVHGQPPPNSSCRALMADLGQFLDNGGIVSILHTTNYQANGQWWGGWAHTDLDRSQNGHLVGSGQRLISNRLALVSSYGLMQPFDVKSPDPISYDIDMQGKITLQGKYGPYQMSCLGNKFATVNSGDSIENFSFSKRAAPR